MASTPTSGTDPLPGTTDSTLGGGGIGSTNNAMGYGAQPGAGSMGTSVADELAGSGASEKAGYQQTAATAGAGGYASGGASAADPASAGGASGTLDDLKNKAGEYAGQATDKAREYADQAKERAASGLHGAADAARDVAEKLAQTQAAPVADYARRAAEGIDRFSDTLQNKSLDDLLSDVRGFVRDKPAIAIGAAAAVGFAIARFLKASPQPSYAADYGSDRDDGRASGAYGSSSTGAGGSGSTDGGHGTSYKPGASAGGTTGTGYGTGGDDIRS